MVSLTTNRREILLSAAGLGAAAAAPLLLSACGSENGGSEGVRQIVIASWPEPPQITSAVTVAGPTQQVSSKIFDGLLFYGLDFAPQPQLATAWDESEDGLAVTFRLREGVLWHDGQPFTSADVAFSVLEVWKKLHSRGRTTFANVEAVDTPDAHTAILRLSKPAPYILSALASAESQIIPRHIYEGGDVFTNPANNAPVGTGPFKFLEWRRGSHIALERNPHYWDQPKPYIDRLIFRLLPDATARATALEAGEAQISLSVSPSDATRLAERPDIQVIRSPGIQANITAWEFNLDRPVFQDVRVRQAIAHAIDRDFIIRNIWFGYADAEESAIPASLAPFHLPDAPKYPFDLDRAAALLDAAGYRPDSQGVRLRFTHDPAPTGQPLRAMGEYIRDTLSRIGVRVEVRSQDFATFVRRTYTDRDFDSIIFSATAGPDPAIGTQRFYWTRNFQPGVAFSNGSHYSNPEVDRLLEAAQVERNTAARTAHYHAFQRIVGRDLPRIPLLSTEAVIVARRSVAGIVTGGYGFIDNSASLRIEAA